MKLTKDIFPDNYATAGCAIPANGNIQCPGKTILENVQSTLPQIEALEQELKEIGDGK